jgi:hypothetical protein
MTYEEIAHRFGGGSLEIWSHVATEEARALAQILEDAGIRGDVFGDGFDYGAGDVRLSFGPLLPHQV